MADANFFNVTIRDFYPSDFESLANYWTLKSSKYWLNLGIDKSKMKSKDQFLNFFNEKYQQHQDVPTVCVIEFEGKPIGVHTVSDLVDHESAVMHAHIFDVEFQKRKIARYSYPKAIDHFLKKLNVKKIIFKTPKINIGANKVKQNLGIPCLGDTVFDSPLAIALLPANLYEVDRLLANQLLKRISG